MTHRHVFAAALGALLCGAAHADFRIGYTTTRGHGELAALSIGSDKLRLDPDRGSRLFDADSTAVFDPARGELLLIDRGEHAYQRIDNTALTRFAGLASLLGAERGIALSVRASGVRERIAGHACEVFRIDLNGAHAADYCMADATELGLNARDATALQRSVEAAHGLLSQLGGTFGRGVFAPGRVPVKLVSYQAGKISGVVELSGVSNAAIGPRTFAVPAGYRQQAIDPSMFVPE